MSGRWRRVLTLAGAAALLVGIIVMLRPFDTRLAVVLDERDMSTAQPCGRPLQEAFRGQDSGGWFAYAPQTGSVSRRVRAVLKPAAGSHSAPRWSGAV